MNWSAWSYVDKKTWAIPEELLPCSAFQLEWFLEWEMEPLLAGGYGKHDGHWKWQLLPVEGGNPTFYSEVEIYGTAIWMPGGEMVAFYIEENANNPIVKTTVPIRPAMLGVPSEATSWVKRADGSWANQAEAGIIMETGWVFGAGLAIFQVYATYQSAIYEVPLAAGLKVNVPFHNVGAFLLPKVANLRIRTVPLPTLAAHRDAVGIFRIALPVNEQFSQKWTADGGHNYVTRKIGTSLSYPSMIKLPDNTLVIAGKFAEANWRAVRSLDDGITWEAAVDIMWDVKYSDCKIACARDGAIITIARHAGKLYCRSSRDGYTATRKIGLASKAFELTCSQETGELMATDGTKVYVSSDGLAWETQVIT